MQADTPITAPPVVVPGVYLENALTSNPHYSTGEKTIYYLNIQIHGEIEVLYALQKRLSNDNWTTSLKHNGMEKSCLFVSASGQIFKVRSLENLLEQAEYDRATGSPMLLIVDKSGKRMLQIPDVCQ